MGTIKDIDRVGLAREEVSEVRLGDQRLNERLGRILGALAARPSASLPQAMESDSALEATYRFLGNERVTAERILAPHVARTVEHCAASARVLAVVDTTEFLFTGEREELGHLRGDRGRGFLAHLALAVGLDGQRIDPLGVLHVETIVRREAPKKQRKARRTGKEPESLRWDRSAEAIHQMLPQAICVMDREADIFALIAQMASRGQSFIIRAAQNRCTEDGLLWDQLADAELFATRNVELPERGRRRGGPASRRFPPRSAHQAKLEMRARTVSLRAPDSTRDRTTERHTTSLPISLVHVIEREPPDGDEPIEWVLLTSLPIRNAEDIAFIVDAYQARWTIEDYFKALKSGCAIEKRQLASVKAMMNILAISIPIAWLILRLRNLARDEPEQPARELLPATMLACLRVLYRKRKHKLLPENPTHKELTWAIAALGGHITNNGPPGLIVLGRGFADLIQATDLFEAIRGDPDVINH